MLRSAIGRLVSSAANPLIWRWRMAGSEAKQRLKGGRRGPPTIVPKYELVKIDLKLCSTDTMVRADQPLLQIPNRTVRQRHDRFRPPPQRALPGLRTRDMPEPSDRRELFQSIGIDRRQRGCLEVGNHRQASTTG